ncbi:MAG: Spy/CpxP family protein refolding chaperone [Gemmatimonadetes bacterium]|nr:Spy/CpxP family protein refolding chaperone [Gemmatimonadota bacterium]
MVRNKTLAFALAGAFAIGGAGLLHAQSEQKAGGMMATMQDCPMMMGMAEGPGAALRHAETLGLTSDQIDRLESLRVEIRDTRKAAMERMRVIHQEIAAAATGQTFDDAAVREAFGPMGDLHGDIGVAVLRARHQTSQVLTADQREAFAGLRSNAMGMMGSMEGMGLMQGMEGMSGMGMMEMMEMMKNCPMMHGGMGNGSADDPSNMRHQEGGA